MGNMLQLTISVVMILSLFHLHNEVSAQSSLQIDQWIKQLESEDWEIREAAANSLIGLPQEFITDKVMKALVNELEREGLRKSASEGQQEYYGWLHDALAATRDNRVFPFIARIGAPTALIKYGDKGIVAILKRLDATTTCSARYYDIEVLSETLQQKPDGYVAQGRKSITDGYVAKGKIRTSIKEAIVKELDRSKHPDKSVEWFDIRAQECGNVRSRIARGLGYLAETGDNEALSILKTMAEKDPYFLDFSKRKDYKGPQMEYPVREDVQKILKELQKNEKKK